MLIDSSSDHIRTLRAVGRSDDHLALRLALGRIFDRVSLRPPGLPTGAIVCVRRMRIGHSSHAEQWTATIGERMTALMRNAVRPFAEPVPANAEAVLFMDEAELLACLARDWRLGDGASWWWRACFGDRLDAPIVQRVFLSSAIYVPAAIERLARAHSVSSVVRALPDTFCAELGAAVASSFAVNGWTEPMRHRNPHRDPAPPYANATGADTRIVRQVASVLRDYPSADVHTLSPAQRALTVLALVLARAPAVARVEGTVAVLRSVERWDAGIEDTFAKNEVSARDRRPEVPRRSRHFEKTESAECSPDFGGAEPQISESRQADGPASHQPLVHAGEVALPLGSRADEGESMHARPSSESAVATSVVPDSGGDEEVPSVHVVRSQFAGIFYLINLALHLELYADFTAPLRPGLVLLIGDFLALIGAHIFDDEFRADPLWNLLADLSGREHIEPPGRDFAAAQEPSLSSTVTDWVSLLSACAAPALDRDEATALPFLCARRGRVAHTSTRLDVTFELAEHPLAIRVAGLDRDPGWVPAAGRVIRFHYE